MIRRGDADKPGLIHILRLLIRVYLRHPRLIKIPASYQFARIASFSVTNRQIPTPREQRISNLSRREAHTNKAETGCFVILSF